MKRLSFYWKYQLTGWIVFTAVLFFFNDRIYHDSKYFSPIAVTVILLGILTTNLIKTIIKSFGIFKNKFSRQLIQLALINITVSIIGTGLWMTIMVNIGLWIIKKRGEGFWLPKLNEEFFFNLFLVLLTLSGWTLIYFLFHYVRRVRKEERLKTAYKLKKAEQESKALRAQMNPHFIFNSMNSIKALIQENRIEESIVYLTTFSKLMRTLINNADKKEITLYDEIETCKLYLQLESMRFDEKFTYEVKVAENIDLKSVQVPALIIQPFIENAIWHGIIPKNNKGHISLKVEKNNNEVEIIVEDDGIGRKLSTQNIAPSNGTHTSKGIALTASRLKLDNLLKHRKGGLSITDKETAAGKSEGTKVVLSFAEE
ncbi:sensor histidine kinase [Flavihumibacter sp. ZG627]|uniref:sensor histidine kinase n=1 Tax=Flavihumibacter sp. ZG627 TaxID=1463156 RepID=UPI000694EBE2|nr:histidine kinase [Flavihumibacter sp. ZG627]